MYKKNKQNIKYLFLLLPLLIIGNSLFAGEDPKPEKFKEEFLKLNKPSYMQIKENFNYNFSEEGKKSSFIAVCLSVLLPGMGELYSGRFDVGKYSLSAEAGLWLTFAGLNIYGNQIKDDGRSFARVHAGFNDVNKDDDYYVNVSNFLNVYEYNDKKLRDRNYQKIYDPNSNMNFSWDSDENRQKFRDMRVNSDQIINSLKYISIALIANRVLSGINAARFTHQYNNSLGSSTSLNVSMGLTANYKNIDGFVINFNKSF